MNPIEVKCMDFQEYVSFNRIEFCRKKKEILVSQLKIFNNNNTYIHSVYKDGYNTYRNKNNVWNSRITRFTGKTFSIKEKNVLTLKPFCKAKKIVTRYKTLELVYHRLIEQEIGWANLYTPKNVKHALFREFHTT